MAKGGFTHESTYNESKEWYTPRYIFDSLNVEFDIDVCSPGADVVSWIPAKRHLTIPDDGLSMDWKGCVWMNPPYGMDTPRWMRKLWRHGNGIGLVFSRTDTQWFHRYAVSASGILFLEKRVQFVSAQQAADYAKGAMVKNSGSGAGSMLIAFGDDGYNALLRAERVGLGRVFRPVSSHCEMDRAEDGSGVIGDGLTDCPNVNTPANDEPGLLFNQ